MNPLPLRKRFRLPSWRVILVAVLSGFVGGILPHVYQGWATRRDYDRRYSKLLELPENISQPKASLHRMPGAVGKTLWIDFYQPNPEDDEKLRAWFTKHDGFSTFKSEYPRIPQPMGDWRAERGTQVLIVSRAD